MSHTVTCCTITSKMLASDHLLILLSILSISRAPLLVVPCFFRSSLSPFLPPTLHPFLTHTLTLFISHSPCLKSICAWSHLSHLCIPRSLRIHFNSCLSTALLSSLRPRFYSFISLYIKHCGHISASRSPLRFPFFPPVPHLPYLHSFPARLQFSIILARLC